MRNKRRSQNEEPGGGSWMDTYGDMVTLLLTFFVLLYSFSTIDAAKWEALVRAFTGSKNVIVEDDPGGNKPITDIHQTPIIPSATESEDNMGIDDPAVISVAPTPTMSPTPLAPTPSPTPAATPTAKPTSKPKATPKPTKANPTPAPTKNPDIERFQNELNQYLNNTPLAGHVTAVIVEDETTIRLIASVIFEPGSDRLLPQAQSVLEGAIKIIAQYKDQITAIRAEGHTDATTPPEGDIESKWELAARRASRVLNYVLEHSQIDPKRAMVVGYGSTRPIADDATEAGREKNNRVDIVLSHN
ncbi:MAG: OmpA family protein [Clostridia bacterium]|nr:OmpA family protein [Clostridia bacterium]